MNDIFFLFDATSSNDINIRSEAFQKLEELFENENFPEILFEILKNTETSGNYHLLAASCLKVWFKRSWCKKSFENQIRFIQQLQSLLLIYHPQYKILFDVYNSVMHIFHNCEVFLSFCGDSIGLISTDTPPNILICVLKLCWTTAKHYLYNLHKDYAQIIVQLFREIHQRLIPFITSVDYLQTSSIGCMIFRYCLKIFYFSINRIHLSQNMALPISNAVQSIINNIHANNDKQYCLLIKFCIQFLYTLYFAKIDGLDGIAQFRDAIFQMHIQFTFNLANNFNNFNSISALIRFLDLNHVQVPITPEIAQILVHISTLSENDMIDYEANPNIFYEYAYSKSDKDNPRFCCFELMSSLCNDNENMIQYLFNLEITESTMYLAVSTIKSILNKNLFSLLTDYIMRCFEFANNSCSLLNLSTFFYLLSKSIKFLDEKFVNKFVVMCYTAAMLSSNTNQSLGESSIIIVITNAIGVIRKMMDSFDIKFPDQLLIRVIEMLPVCPTYDASKAIDSYLRSYNNDTLFPFISQIESYICERAYAESSKEFPEFSLIASALNTLSSLIDLAGVEAITIPLCIFIEHEIEFFDNHISESLCTLLLTIFSKGAPESKQIIIILIRTFESDKHFRNSYMDSFNKIFLFYLMHFPNEFIDDNMALSIVALGVKYSKEALQIENEKYCVDLICYCIQTDTNIDVSELILFIQKKPLFYYIMILMSIIVSRPSIQIENALPTITEWIMKDNAKCPYEKHLGVLSLLALCNSDDIMKIALELLNQEKNQRLDISRAGSSVLCHEYPTPIEFLDRYNIMNYINTAINNCSPENRPLFLSSLEKILSP